MNCWPREVAAIYKRCVDVVGVGAMNYGPAHIVWDDGNFDSGSIQWCIDNAWKNRNELGDDAVAVVIQSLHDLASVSESIRCA